MYQVIHQDGDQIEFGLWDELSEDEFRQVIHQLESLCTAHQKINVLFDAAGMEKYNFKMLMDEFDFYKKYRSHLDRVALVSDRKFEKFILDQFNKFTDTEFRTFGNEQIEEARKWIFPSRLP